MNEPRDPIAYRIAIGTLGLAVAVIFLGIAWAAVSHPRPVPIGFWLAGGALSGVFVGALIPFSLRVRTPYLRAPECAVGCMVGGLLLVAFCIAATTLGVVKESQPLDVLAATIAGVLLGLPIPSPGERVGAGR